VIAYLDTQVVVRLCEGRRKDLGAKAIKSLERDDLVISPIVSLELQYLYEIGRTKRAAGALIGQLEAQIGLKVRDLGIQAIVAASVFEDWTRDPFDRLIVSQAKADGFSTLLTSDEKIRRYYPKAIW